MIDSTIFIKQCKELLFGSTMSAKQVGGCKAIIDYWNANYDGYDPRWLAYMLATTYHETARTMQPIEEYGKGAGRAYGKRVKMDGRPYTDTKAIFYGRGFVQLTWYENYEKAGKAFDLPLLLSPELALNLKVATKILFAGMMKGWFTGKRLSDYFNDRVDDPVNARRIINGKDKAALIEGYYEKFLTAINTTGEAARAATINPFF